MEGGPLSPGQRYHFVAGWLPWVADGCNLLFNLARWLVGRHGVGAEQIEPPLSCTRCCRCRCSPSTRKARAPVPRARRRQRAQTLAAAIAGLALTHTIAKRR